MRSVFFWATFPLLVPQALNVRRTAPRFAAAAGPREGAVGSGKQKKLFAVGDSIIAGVGASSLSRALVGQASLALAGALKCRVEWRARGEIGASSATVLRELINPEQAAGADFIVLSVGVNDITSLTRISSWKKNLAGLLERFTALSPSAVVAVAGIPPLGSFPLLPQPLRAVFGVRGQCFDQAARRVVTDFPNAVHIPLDFDTRPEKFAADGFHPSEQGYAEFGEAVAAGIVAKRHG